MHAGKALDQIQKRMEPYGSALVCAGPKACFEGHHLKCAVRLQGVRERTGKFENFLYEQCLWGLLPFLKGDVLDTYKQLKSNQDIPDELIICLL